MFFNQGFEKVYIQRALPEMARNEPLLGLGYVDENGRKQERLVSPSLFIFVS